jgi:hypothetical protein
MEDRFVAALLSASISKDTKNLTTPMQQVHGPVCFGEKIQLVEACSHE